MSEDTGVVGGLTSSQKYFARLEEVFNQDEHRLRQLRKELGDIQVEKSHGYITITYRPGGGVHRFPLSVGTVAVDGERLEKIQCSGEYAHAFGYIPPNISGQPYILGCHLDS